jgi:predicted regulator of Ras-like GTPase activity (Roadblock/LC7/MglB family)
VKSLANEAYTLALKDTLDGMTHSFPCIKNALIFDEKGNIIAVDDKTPEDAAVRTVDALDEMLNKADLLDNLENAVFEGAKGWLNVSRFDDLFLVTVTSTKTNLDQANAFANALVPTVLKVLRRVNLTPVKESLEELEAEHEQPLAHDSKEQPDEHDEETSIEEHPDEHAEGAASKPVLPEPQVNQFIVENLGGLFASSETVRIDNELLSKWKEMYDNREVEEVEIATFGGKSVRCKVKPIKDTKFEGKGLVQIHEKVQSTLDITKGELVRVKPVIE